MTRAFHLWLPAYLRRAPRPHVEGVSDILLAVCDHFEPFHHTDRAGALARMAEWNEHFPRAIEPFRDSDGVRPRHTFFYPIEQSDPAVLDSLRTLCRASGGEAELHLHHDRDTPAHLRETLERGKRDLVAHGFLPRDKSGTVRYGFVHGNWALDDSHPDGICCGVPDELGILRDTGCYADFTMPSAPDPTQTRTINSIYYAADTPAPKSHDFGEPVRVNPSPMPDAPERPRPGELLMVQGPLALNWEWRKFGVLPRVENAALTAHNPPRPDRLRIWLRLGIHVPGRPEWVFIKLHTHGAPAPASGVFLGEPMRRFHEHLLAEFNDGRKYRVHYVTAREMANIIHAAEDGRTGNPGAFRDFRYRLAS